MEEAHLPRALRNPSGAFPVPSGGVCTPTIESEREGLARTAFAMHVHLHRQGAAVVIVCRSLPQQPSASSLLVCHDAFGAR